MSEKRAQFRLIGYTINKSVFQFSGGALGDALNFNLAKGGKQGDTDRLYQSELTFTASDTEGKIKMEVVLHGTFEFDEGLSEDVRKTFFMVNAPAILFPYLRAYISTLSSLAGIPPIILPTINLSAND